MNEVKTFRAASMQEALAIVRRELGMDAVILHTKQITHRRLIPFLKPREEVEITAGVSLASRTEPARTAVDARSTAVTTPTTTRTATTRTTSANGSNTVATRSAAAVADSESEIVTGISKAAQIAAELERRQTDRRKLDDSLKSLERLNGKTPTPSPEVISSTTDVDDVWVGSPLGTKSSLPTSDRSRETRAARSTQRETPRGAPQRPVHNRLPNDVGIDVDTHVPTHQAAHLAAAMQATAPQTTNVNELTAKLDALQKMVENLTKSNSFRQHDEVPSELFDVYTRLIDADIEDALARDLVFRLRDTCSPEQLSNPTASLAMLTGMVEADLKCASPIRATVGRRKVVALVGPTGVGKTTTIAKLAANFRLRDGIKMGLVTVDTYRIAAVEQLRTYAEIIDLPMKVVTSPQDMRRALDELTGLDLVLIDTAGRSPRDDLKIQELKSLLSEATIDEVHLVMSLTASVRGIQMTAEQFKPVNPTAMVLTKLDEAAGMGSLLSVSRQVALPISYVTTGQDVPDDIEPANASRLARLVLGEDRLFD